MTVNYIIFTIYIRLPALKLMDVLWSSWMYFDGGELQQNSDKGAFKIYSYNTTIQQNLKKAATFLHLISTLDIQIVCKSTNDEYLDRGL